MRSHSFTHASILRGRLMYAVSQFYASFLSASLKPCTSAFSSKHGKTFSFSLRPMSLCRDGASSPLPEADAAGTRAPDVIEFLDSLKNYEKLGVPKGAGTECAEGFDLARMHRLLSDLGDPLSHYPVIHVAGTKGKGSTAAFISNILRAQGYSVGTYTSPHIRSLHERIIAGKTENLIASDAFQELFQDNRKLIEASITAEEDSLTYFEVLTALAFKYFARVKVDIAVVEAGLGGARDATNVITPAGLAAAVITNIGKEHLAALGGSLESIALAKSGIIKQGRPVVLGGPLDPTIEKIICDVAAAKSSSVIRAFGEGMQYNVSNVKLADGGAFQCCDLNINLVLSSGSSPSWKLDKKSLQLRMMGRHQLDNALTAICTILCLRHQGWQVEENAIWFGLEQTFATGRFQVMSQAESVKVGCEQATLVLDGAHTASSANALACTLEMVFPSAALALVVAMASDKDHVEFGSEVLSGAVVPKAVILTETLVAGARLRSAPAALLAQRWGQAAKSQNIEFSHIQAKDEIKSLQPNPALVIMESESVVSAITKASRFLCDHAGQERIVCVTGSLHVVSEVLAYVRADS